MSARYRELPEEFYVPKPEHIGVQSKDNKQGRDLSTDRDMLVPSMIDMTCRHAFEAYRALLAQDVPREIARSVLPVATYSHMFATVDLLNLLRFLTLRCDAHAQHEIRVYADAMRDLARVVVPVCIGAWEAKR